MDHGRYSVCKKAALSLNFASRELCRVSYESVLCVLAQETRDLTRAKSRAKSESPAPRACGNTGQDCVAVKVGRGAS